MEDLYPIQRWLFLGRCHHDLTRASVRPGGYSERAITGPQYSQSALRLDMPERYKRWAADTAHGHKILAFLGISGLLLLGLAGLAILVGRLF